MLFRGCAENGDFISYKLIDVHKVTSKNGNELVFVKLGNSHTYENIELMLNKNSIDISNFSIGEDVECVLSYDKNWSSCYLYKLKEVDNK